MATEEPGPLGKCPHCQEEITPDQKKLYQRPEDGGALFISSVIVCPECETIIGGTESGLEFEGK